METNLPLLYRSSHGVEVTHNKRMLFAPAGLGSSLRRTSLRAQMRMLKPRRIQVYESNFLEALERTTRFGLSTPSVELSDARFLTQEALSRLPFAIRDIMGELDEDDVVAQCLSLHMRLKPVIEQILGCNAFYTIGWVSFKDSEIFKQTEESLSEMLESGITGPDVNIHAWLTLPSMEVLDFSLPTTYAKVNGIEEGKGGVIAMYASDLADGMMYQPMLVGEEFLAKSGAMRFFATYSV